MESTFEMVLKYITETKRILPIPDIPAVVNAGKKNAPGLEHKKKTYHQIVFYVYEMFRGDLDSRRSTIETRIKASLDIETEIGVFDFPTQETVTSVMTRIGDTFDVRIGEIEPIKEYGTYGDREKEFVLFLAAVEINYYA